MDRSRYVIPEPEKFIFLTYRAVGWLAAVVRTRGSTPKPRTAVKADDL